MALATSQPTVQDGPAGPAAHQPPQAQTPDRLDADRRKELRAIEARTLEKIKNPAQDPAPAQELTAAQDPAQELTPAQIPAPVQGIAPAQGPAPAQNPAQAQHPCPARDLTPAQDAPPTRDHTPAQGPAAAQDPAPAQAPAQRPARAQDPAPAERPSPMRGPAAAQDLPLVQDLTLMQDLTPAQDLAPAEDLTLTQGLTPAQSPAPVQGRPASIPDPAPERDSPPMRDLPLTQGPAPADDPARTEGPSPVQDPARAQDLAPAHRPAPAQAPTLIRDLTLTPDLAPVEGSSPAQGPAPAEGLTPVGPAPAHDSSLVQDLAPVEGSSPVQGLAPAQSPARIEGPSPVHNLITVQAPAPAQDSPPVEGPSPVECLTPALDLAPVRGFAPAQNSSPAQNLAPALDPSVQDPAPAQDLSPVQDLCPVQDLATAPDPAPAQDPAPVRELSPAEDLARLLFGEDQERERIHGPWRRLIQDETFRHQPGRTPAQQAAQAYDWLRMANDTLDDPQALATDPAQLAALHEWTAIVDGGGSLCTLASIHYNLFLGSLLDHEKAGHRDLTPYTSLQRIGTFLCTEVEHGNDSAALETTATYDPAGGGFILNTPHPGAQKFMPNTSLTGGPKTAVVAARLIIDGHDEGVYLFLTPLSDETGILPGIRVRPLPMRPTAPVDHCLTAFDHVPLPREALLESDHGHLTDDGTLTSSLGNRRKRFLRSIARVTTGKLCMSAAAIGASRAALTIAVQYGEHRHVSGPRPGERITVNTHRTHHAPLLNSIATAYAMTLLHRTALDTWTHHTPDTRDHAERLTAITKAWNTWQARTITTQARERCGAQGLFAVNHLANLPDYIEGTITAEGDNLVIWAKAAAELLLTPHTPPPTPPTHTGPPDLTNPHHIHTLLTHAENIWHTRARTALRNAPPKNPAGRWNHASTPALEMLTLHTTNHATTALLNATHNTTNPHTKTLLTHLTHLFLLHQLRPHTGDLITHHHLTPQQNNQLPTLTDTLTHTLAPHLTTLTQAFNLPTPYLNAIPITTTHRPTLTNYTHP
ncbi:acyl-CoA dehydrogenase [Streptomyces sp. f51]|uniref:acyl-CoA dehydrogenase family protein n=1 Tax=Streptomyces sp. f51 TaxID=1827742 RepID=UPI0030CC0377